jgi:predicted transcriptional regulator
MNFKIAQKIIDLITLEDSGKPFDFATKLNISERMLYKYLSELKTEFKAPIKYSRQKKSYFFDGKGELVLRWQEKIKVLPK